MTRSAILLALAERHELLSGRGRNASFMRSQVLQEHWDTLTGLELAIEYSKQQLAAMQALLEFRRQHAPTAEQVQELEDAFLADAEERLARRGAS